MKHGKTPTKREKTAIKSSGLNPDNWLVYKKVHSTLQVVHRETGTTKTILL